ETVAGSVAAPWAKDAQGRPVPTRYTAEGHTLVQDIDTNENTAFPVVADPKITFGWGVYINMWGHELGAAALAVGFGVEVGLAYICGKAKLILGTACGLAVGGKVLFPTWADRPAGAGPSEIRGPDAPTAGPGYGYGYGRGGRPPHGHQ